MSEPRPLTRRELLQTAAVAAGTTALAATGLAQTAGPRHVSKLPTRPLGKTGRSVSMLALGTGSLVGGRSLDEAAEIAGHAIDSGITYIDTAEQYKSEAQVGRAIAGRRSELFVATKTLKRDYDGAMRDLEQSLRLLGTDYLDLWQVHSIGHQNRSGQQEVERLREENSVMKAMRKAKAEGVARLIGFTGHTNPDYMLAVLGADDLVFDTMLLVISAALARKNQRGWEDRVLPVARKKGLGLVAMKVLGGGKAVGKGEKKASAAELLNYVWERGLPVASVGLYSKKEIDAAVAACKAYAAKGKSSNAAPAGSAEPPAADWALRARFRDVTLPFERPGYRDGWTHSAV